LVIAVKKIVLWLMSTLTVLVLLFGYHTSTSSTSAAAVRGGNASLAAPVQGGTDSSASTDTFSTSGGASPSAGSSSAAAPSSSAAASPTPAAGGATTSTKVTGTVASTRWGPVQVQLSVANRKITNVAVIQYPSGNGRDQEINSYALPQLIQETLKAQSANIDMVSGATVTSDGYLQSLQSALDRAGI
jgi:uncharacterized protein with FMN-binding domain